MADILVIGYGNELRGDDGLGPLVARSLAAPNIPGVCVRIARQLLPELAADLAEAQLAIFVDASVESCGLKAVRLRASEDTYAWCTHWADPCTLLALTQVAYGRTPEAWWLTVPGRNFEFGEGLSNVARKNARQAIVHLTRFIQAWQQCSPK